MPTIDQGIEYLKKKREKYGGDGHINQIVVSEESRRNAIENKPDENGRQHTRISFETYSPKAYSDWHSMMERLIERCGFNPLILCDLLQLLVREAERNQVIDYFNGRLQGQTADGIDIALQGLYKANPSYEEDLRTAKTERRLKRLRK